MVMDALAHFHGIWCQVLRNIKVLLIHLGNIKGISLIQFGILLIYHTMNEISVGGNSKQAAMNYSVQTIQEARSA